MNAVVDNKDIVVVYVERTQSVVFDDAQKSVVAVGPVQKVVAVGGGGEGEGGGSGDMLAALTALGSSKQDTLVSGTNIKTINGASVLGSGDLTISDGLVIGTPVASTSGSSIEYTSIPAGVKRISVAFSGVSTNGTGFPYVRIGPSGGVETTGYSGSINNYNGGAVANFSTSFPLVTSNVAAQTISGILVLQLVDPASNLWSVSANIGRGDSASFYTIAGTKALAGALSRIQIATPDTFDGGKINIAYE